ncbi:MAG: hypothetical protein WDO72_15910 [Pseudomonadota bacterium]
MNGRYLKCWLPLLGLCAAASFAAAEDGALRAVEACRERLDPRVDVGIERVQRRCPELLPALEHSPYRELLPHTLRERREEITAESLRAMADLLRHATAETPARAAPRQELLAPVLAELGEQGRTGVTRWERFKRWLKQKFESRPDDDETGWLEKWSRQFHTSEGVARALTYAGYAVLAALVLFVVWGELRAAGLLGGMRRAARRVNPAAEWRRRLMLADVNAAPLADRPGMLLRLLGEALTRSHRLPAPQGLTARAIARRAELDSAEDRAALEHVAATAEEVRYAGRRVGEQNLEGAVSSAKALLQKFTRPEKR